MIKIGKAARIILALGIAAGVSAVVFANSSILAMSETGRTDYRVMDGVTESTVYLVDSGNRNVRAHILDIDSSAEVTFRATYRNYYTKGSTKASRKEYADSWDSSKWGYQKLRTQALAYESAAENDGDVIAASNGDFYTGKGIPQGNFVMEGNIVHKSTKEPFFAVAEDGKAEIRYQEQGLEGVNEAIAGSDLIVNEGKVCVEKNSDLQPRQAIGIKKDGGVVIVNVDGREPSSSGASLYDLAQIFVRLDCERAINFDGGGSATFLTKREGDNALKYRNVPGDGFERNVSSSLLIVRKRDMQDTSIGNASKSLKDAKTYIKKTEGVYRYLAGGKKLSGFYVINGKSFLLKNGKGLTKTVTIGKYKYTFKGGLLTKCSDSKSGTVQVGYCGAEKGGRNLIYAWHTGDKVLCIGVNPLEGKSGKMANWSGSNSLKLPWYSMRSGVKKVYIGSGVKNIGDRFLYVASGKILDGSTAPTGKLKYVSIPSSVTKIGNSAFYNKPYLKNVIIPKKVSSIGNNAFGHGGKGYVRFKGKSVPKIGKTAFKATKYKKIYARKNAKWKAIKKKKKYRKWGFNKTVKVKLYK